MLIDVLLITEAKDVFVSAPTASCSITVGGAAGGAGNGNAVAVTNSGVIATQGSSAHGILAQSIGRGGGAGGSATSISADFGNPLENAKFIGFLDFSTTIKIGGAGGGGGNGGTVTATNSGGLSTAGNFAAGILAQSIGGGGGTVGGVFSDDFGMTFQMYKSREITLDGGSGASGGGGVVNVHNEANISTRGVFAPGILAQSIGGGGGFVAIDQTGATIALQIPKASGLVLNSSDVGVGFAGSLGGAGSASAVTVNHTGDITTMGRMSHGILAQSITGWRTSGAVTVTVGAGSHIVASGLDADGIRVQSLATSGCGPISVTTAAGSNIRGGSGQGAGVHIDGGANNVLTNYGSISALSGVAIIGSDSSDSIQNDGTVIGSVRLGGGTNEFENNGRINSGEAIDLGGGLLRNLGTVSPGGPGAVGHTSVVGSFAQSGALEIDIAGTGAGMCDMIDITGRLEDQLGPDGLTPSLGTVNFSFVSGNDISADVAPHESAMFPFLQADAIDSLTLLPSYVCPSGPEGFTYEVVLQGGTTFCLAATNTTPEPLTLALLALGGLAVVHRRRLRKAPAGIA
jgi:hypothetical protein